MLGRLGWYVACGRLTPSLQRRRSKKLSRLELLDQESVLVDNEQSSGFTSLLEPSTSDIIQGPSVSQVDGDQVRCRKK